MNADNNGRSRRDFFYLAGALAVGTASGQNRVKTVEPESPQIGILLATAFTTGTLEARLDAAKARGLACVQISMAAAGLPEMPSLDQTMSTFDMCLGGKSLSSIATRRERTGWYRSCLT